jgi:hypothetical protein
LTSFCGSLVLSASVSEFQKPVQALIIHLQDAAHVRGLGRVEEQAGLGRVAVARDVAP